MFGTLWQLQFYNIVTGQVGFSIWNYKNYPSLSAEDNKSDILNKKYEKLKEREEK